MDILTAEEQTLQSCIEVNNKNQYLNTENIKLVSDMILENIEFIENDKMNDHREQKRMDLLELKAQMRDAELEAEGEIIANLNLKKILEIESKLYEDKNAHQSSVFEEVQTDIN